MKKLHRIILIIIIVVTVYSCNVFIFSDSNRVEKTSFDSLNIDIEIPILKK